jgi:hypothetical protein
MNNVVIAADLGRFKAYRITRDSEEGTSPRIELIEAFDTIEGRERMGELYTDSPGAFRRKGSGKTSASSGFGERHNIGLEKERRLVRLAADSINDLLLKEGLPKWHLSACKSINKSILECLAPLVKARLGMNLKADLTNAKKAEILKRFAC